MYIKIKILLWVSKWVVIILDSISFEPNGNGLYLFWYDFNCIIKSVIVRILIRFNDFHQMKHFIIQNTVQFLCNSTVCGKDKMLKIVHWLWFFRKCVGKYWIPTEHGINCSNLCAIHFERYVWHFLVHHCVFIHLSKKNKWRFCGIRLIFSKISPMDI